MEKCPICRRMTAEENPSTGKLTCYNWYCPPKPSSRRIKCPYCEEILLGYEGYTDQELLEIHCENRYEQVKDLLIGDHTEVNPCYGKHIQSVNGTKRPRRMLRD